MARTWGRLLAALGKFLTQDPGAEAILDFAQEQNTRIADDRKREEVAV